MNGSSNLFVPVRVGSTTLDNRIVMAPMTRNRAGEGNVPTPLMARYYAQRASAGLIVTEGAQISPEGIGYPNTPGIHTDAQVEGWREVTSAVHARGGTIFLQLWHVGRISHPSLQPDGALPIAPSAVRPAGEVFTHEGRRPFVEPRALETAEIADVVARFGAATMRAREADFDGVEIHGANGYLVDQFLVDGTNRRADRYGGSVENRARFLVEVTEAVVGAWSADRVGVRLSPRGTFNDITDSDRPATFGHAVERLDEFGLAYLHLVDPLPGHAMDNVTAPRFTAALRARFGGPVILNGGYDAETASTAILHGEADLVAFGVPFLANPDLPARLRAGAPLNPPDVSTFYGGDSRGYVDYPTLEEVTAASA
jgi:N-ethylmaleimide reductase